jgi:hypothetical protein
MQFICKRFGKNRIIVFIQYVLAVYMIKKSLRRERFETVAARRTQRILDFLDSLSNCSNKNNYEYTDADVKKMFSSIREKVKNTEAAFGNALNRSEKNKFKF